MRNHHPWSRLIRSGLIWLIVLCVFSLGATRKGKEPEFSDLPGPSEPAAATPAAPAQTTNPSAPPVAAPNAPPPVGTNLAPGEPPRPSLELGQGKTLYSFQATDLDLRAALAAFARANNLNIIPDNDVTGTVTLDVRDLPLDQMMEALLEAGDCTWSQKGGLIRVHSAETRTFVVDYLRLSRKGVGQSSATLNSASAGGSGGAGAGMGGGIGGGMSGGMGGGGNGSAGGTTGGTGGSSINLTADNPIDFWKELKEELGFLLTAKGKTAVAINMTAGLVQVTDRPSALKKVEEYLNGVDKSVHRQVEIEAKLYNVALNDQFQFGIDWTHVAAAYGGSLGFGAATLPVANGGVPLQDSALSGLGHTPGTANPFTLVFSNFNTSAAINALSQQGNVQVIAKPQIRTLNNQTALIKVGTETPFFAQTFQSLQSQSGNQTFSGDQITTVTVGTILSITPQISGDDWVSLDISPVLTSLVDTRLSPSRTATAPVLDTKQASTLVRVHDNNTVVMGGLIQTQRASNDTKVPLLGDIPLLGKLFTGTFRAKQKSELVIFVTPRIIREGQERPLPAVPEEPDDFGEKHAKR